MAVIVRMTAVVVLSCLAACADPQPVAPTITFEPYEFETADGATVEAERGVFRVPD